MTPARTNQLVVGLFILLLVGGFAWWFLHNYERVSYQEHSDMSPEARRNPLLAAERLLSRLGQQTESRSGREFLIHPPSTSGVLLVRDLGAPLPQERVDDLLAWVESGGRLIAAPGRLQDDELARPLLESFGVELIRLGLPAELAWLEQAAKEMEEEGQKRTEAETLSILLPGDDQVPFDIAFDTHSWFAVDYPFEYWQTPAEDSPHLLRFPLGEGEVVFLSDSEIFDNTRIGDFDHAPLLAELTAGSEQVWLLYSSQMPSLFQLLWRWAPYLVVSLALFASLLIWRMGRRSGPRIAGGQLQRRDLLEHLQAAAEYNWRIDPAAGLLRRARKQVEKRWLIAHPQLQRLDHAARCEWLASRTGLTAEAVDLALYNDRTDSGQMIKITANLQRLLAALHPQRQKR